MGFAVTASHLIFAVALLSAGSFATATYWKVSSDVEEARRAEAALVEELAHTSLVISGTPTYTGASLRFELDVKNNGSIVLEIDEFTYILDGAVHTTIASGYPSIAGAAGTNLLLPGETKTVRLESVASSPNNAAVIAPNGVAAYWQT